MQARSQVAGGRLLPTWPLLPLAAADVGRRASQGFRSRGTTSRLQAGCRASNASLQGRWISGGRELCPGGQFRTTT